MAGSYIPAADAPFDSWADNFATLLTADPTVYGETVGTAAVVQAAYDAWEAAYALATNPATRTSPTIADKDAARVSLEASIRPVAQRINANAAVTNMQREDLGITVRKVGRTPVPPPSTAPTLALVSAIPNQQRLSIRDEATPTSKAKPFGAIGVQLFRSIGEVAATDPSQCSLLGITTKTPVEVANMTADAGKVVTYFARWTTRSGPGGISQVGPWSSPLNAIVM